MKINTFALMIMALYLAGAALAASSSASYKLTTQAMSSGAAAGTSATYSARTMTRGEGMAQVTSTSYIFGHGFAKSAYFSSAILAPIVTSIDPSTATNDQTVSMTITGANFVDGATVKLSATGEADITATSVAVVTSAKITCLFNISGAKAGLWNVTVTNTSGQAGTLPAAFKITYPAPTVASITPGSGVNSGVVSITALAGTNFRGGAAVKLSRTGEPDIAAESVVVESSGKITCQFNITGKTTGLWDVTVTNDDSQSGTLASGFKIETQNIIITEPVKSTKNPFDPATGATTIQYGLSKDA